ARSFFRYPSRGPARGGTSRHGGRLLARQALGRPAQFLQRLGQATVQLLFDPGAVVVMQRGGEGGAQERDGPRVLSQLLVARGAAAPVDRRLLFLPAGVQQAGRLLLTVRRPRQFRGRLFLAPVVSQGLGVGQQPRCLAEHLVDQGGGRLGLRTTHWLVPPG